MKENSKQKNNGSAVYERYQEGMKKDEAINPVNGPRTHIPP